MTTLINTPQTTLTGREKSLLIVFIVIMIGTLPFTYIWFGLPFLYVPIAAFAVFVVAGNIRNTLAVRTIQTVTILAGLTAIWISSILYNFYMAMQV